MIALVLAIDIDRECLVARERVDLNRVIDHEVDGNEWVDPAGVAALALHRGPHRGEVDHRGNSCEVLEDDARRRERKLTILDRLLAPHRQGVDLIFGGVLRAGDAKQVLEQDLDGVWNLVELGLGALLEHGQVVIVERARFCFE